MLERRNRLRGGETFQRLFSRGKRIFSGGVGCFVLSEKNDTLVVGVTFKQTAFPKAVTRHAYKRRTLAWVREHLADFPRGKTLVFHFQRPLPEPYARSLKSALAQIIQSIKKI